MFSTLTRSLTAYLATAVLLTLGILTACQASNPTEQSGPAPPVAKQEVNRTLSSGRGLSVASLYRPPQNVQDLVNRSHAIVIGTISAISGTAQTLPYGKTAEDYQDEKYQGYSPRYPVTYYDIVIEEVLLDDGNVRSHPRIRMTDEHNPMRPQIGERFLFTLMAAPDSLTYGIATDWNLLPLDGGDIRNYDGTSPGYVGVTDEASLLEGIKEAVPNHDFLPPNQWPSRFNTGAGEGGPSEPGGSGSATGPTGNTGEGSQ